MDTTQGGQKGVPVEPIKRRGLRTREAIAAYPVSRQKLYRMLDAGELPDVKWGGTRIWPVDALEAKLKP
jgi:predicted DNA-binding transcriptional regulator AlpA